MSDVQKIVQFWGWGSEFVGQTEHWTNEEAEIKKNKEERNLKK